MVERGGELSLSRPCELLGIGRASLYRELAGESESSLALMRRIDELYMECPFYGSRQMARHLRRKGAAAGRHRIRRLMRLMGLEAVCPKPRTSEPHPQHKVYSYLIRGVAVERPDQVWCADITYVPARGGFLYLVAVMDWATRFVLSWRLSNTLDAAFCVAALEDALGGGAPGVFNTDQGGAPSSPAWRCFPPPSHRRFSCSGDRARGKPVENATRGPPRPLTRRRRPTTLTPRASTTERNTP